MFYTAEQISSLVNGEIEGDSKVKVDRPANIEDATAGTITFLANPKYENYVYHTEASIILVSQKFTPRSRIKPTLIRVTNVYEALGTLLDFVNKGERLPKGVSGKATIGKNVIFGKDVSVGDFVVIGDNVKIGDGTIIHDQVYIGPHVTIGKNCRFLPGVRIMHETEIGHSCVIQSNAVIGSDGFGFAKNVDGEYSKIPQVGKVVIGNNVEIGALVAIDRATMGKTTIEDGVKLDNLIQIAHNVKVGKHSVIAAQAGIAGSTKLGPHNVIGGQVGIIGHLNLPGKLQVQAQSGIISGKVKEGDKLFGSPALNYQNYLKSYALFKKLPKMQKEISKLKETLKNIESKKNEK